MEKFFSRVSAFALALALFAAPSVSFGLEAASVFRDVLVWDAERSAAEPADVVCRDGRITEIVPPRTATGGIVFDGEGRTALLPGLVNAHTHASMTLLRGVGEGLPLSRWLNEAIFPIEAKLTPEHIRAGAELAMLEMLASGTTAFADMYFSMDAVADAVDKAGMRAALCESIVGFDEKIIGKTVALAERYAGHDRVTVQFGPPRAATSRLSTIRRATSNWGAASPPSRRCWTRGFASPSARTARQATTVSTCGWRCGRRPSCTKDSPSTRRP